MTTVENTGNRQEYGKSATPLIPPDLAGLVQVVRLAMRDFPSTNRLIREEESIDRMIVWAIVDALDDFNNTPPLLGFQLCEIPMSIMRRGAMVNLFESLAIFHTRNGLAYSDGGINVNLDKGPQYMQLWQMMSATYEQKKKEWKIAQNIERGWGSVSSEYWWISGFYGAW